MVSTSHFGSFSEMQSRIRDEVHRNVVEGVIFPPDEENALHDAMRQASRSPRDAEEVLHRLAHQRELFRYHRNPHYLRGGGGGGGSGGAGLANQTIHLSEPTPKKQKNKKLLLTKY